MELCIHKSKTSKGLSIEIHPSGTFLKSFIEDPYFKAFKGPDINKAEKEDGITR